MIARLFPLAAGLVFGAGLVIAGMTSTSKVIGFLDLTGAWDPSLALVIVGAVTVHFGLLRAVTQRRAPLFEERFHLPTRKDVDGRLIVGSSLFGVGWGLGGLCPGPALTSAAAGVFPAILFVFAMTVGMLLERAYSRRAKGPPATLPTPSEVSQAAP